MNFGPIFEHLGIHALFERVRLGRGVLGRMRDAFIAAMIIFALAMFKLNSPEYVILELGLVTLVLIVFIGGALWYGHAHPAEAVLEDADLVSAYRIRDASKGVGILPDATLESRPVEELPLTVDPNKPDDDV